MTIPEMVRRILKLEEEVRRLKNNSAPGGYLARTTRGVTRKTVSTPTKQNADNMPRWA